MRADKSDFEAGAHAPVRYIESHNVVQKIRREISVTNFEIVSPILKYLRIQNNLEYDQ